MTIPSWIMVGRFFVSLCSIILHMEKHFLALTVCSVECIRYVRRISGSMMKSKTELGAYLDPIADKTLFSRFFNA